MLTPLICLFLDPQGRPLQRPQVISGGKSLKLLHLTHRDAGLYTCVASNPEGDGQSNAVTLKIQCEYIGSSFQSISSPSYNFL